MTLVGLVREVVGKDGFICAFMATGLEFKGVVQFVKQTCHELGVPLIISNPGMYKGNFFKRLEQFRRFPLMKGPQWCCRDLKLRPQKKLLQKEFGRGATLYKLEGIRRSESARRKYIYKEYTESLMRPDSEHKGSFEVFPLLNWSDADVLNYLEMKGMKTSGLYKRFGVSGCAWCPFYTVGIYREILREVPSQFDRVIEMEDKLGQPSVAGNIYLGDIKAEVVNGVPLPVPVVDEEGRGGRPCTMMMEGKEVRTCEVYGHFFVEGHCFRCGEKE